MARIRNLLVFLGLILFTVTVFDNHVTADVIPSENECRPYIEKAIHELKNVEGTGSVDDNESTEDNTTENVSIENEKALETGNDEGDKETVEDDGNDSTEPGNSDDDQSDDDTPSQENQTEENASLEDAAQDNTAEDSNDDNESNQQDDSKEDKDGDDTPSLEAKADDDKDSQENGSEESSKEQTDDAKDADEASNDADDNSKENTADDDNDSKQDVDDDDSTPEDNEDEQAPEAAESEQANDDGSNEESAEKSANESGEEENSENKSVDESETAEESSTENASTNEADDNSKEASAEDDNNDDEATEETVRAKRSIPNEAKSDEQDDSTQDDQDQDKSQETANEASNENDSKEDSTDSAAVESKENETESGEDANNSGEPAQSEENSAEDDDVEEESPEEDLTMEFEIPKNLRPRGHVSDLLGLDEESSIKENALKRTGDVVLKELKRVFDNAIKPLETMYKYRDLSNRHFGDPEIFSKPLILFMGPWSGGKSTILNYLTENEYTPNSIRSGAEPSPAYFNILMHGEQPEVLDGTQLAADWTFSGLQKFGQGLMDRLRGQKLPNKLLERVNIVEIPGILEVRKQVSKYFPFNDACQWFIDRADIIFLVYDPSKLDVGPETEAILDQLKGREYQTKILLNKADQVKPEELLRVQGALIWNISPLMSSAQPPVMYTVSLWSHPFENGAPIRLLQAQERAFLSDLREAIDKRIENKIASARRFAVRIRNHAKMVDCYLTTYYNQKGLFSNKKQVADKIIEHPQNYNIYEGLSTLTNISRYDLPDPEVYMDFFRLNPLFEFKKLSETCTYFKGCPINKLDIAIAYELPELVGKYKKLLEQNLIQTRKEYDENCNQTEPEPPVKIIKSR